MTRFPPSPASPALSVASTAFSWPSLPRTPLLPLRFPRKFPTILALPSNFLQHGSFFRALDTPTITSKSVSTLRSAVEDSSAGRRKRRGCRGGRRKRVGSRRFTSRRLPAHLRRSQSVAARPSSPPSVPPTPLLSTSSWIENSHPHAWTQDDGSGIDFCGSFLAPGAPFIDVAGLREAVHMDP
eukprot:tig00020951_g16464.t1